MATSTTQQLMRRNTTPRKPLFHPSPPRFCSLFCSVQYRDGRRPLGNGYSDSAQAEARANGCPRLVRAVLISPEKPKLIFSSRFLDPPPVLALPPPARFAPCSPPVHFRSPIKFSPLLHRFHRTAKSRTTSEVPGLSTVTSEPPATSPSSCTPSPSTRPTTFHRSGQVKRRF